jgi:hypothetical protein
MIEGSDRKINWTRVKEMAQKYGRTFDAKAFEAWTKA